MNLHLNKLKNFHGRKGPLLLIIMDGVGLGKEDDSNAVYLAKTPTLDRLFKSNLFTTLKAHGPAVGLPGEGDMGNSEVGHNAIGAGRVFAQGAKLVNLSIESGKIFESESWKNIIARGKKAARFILWDFYRTEMCIPTSIIFLQCWKDVKRRELSASDFISCWTVGM